MLVTSFHVFQLCLNPAPVALNVVGMYTRNWILKVQGMINSAVSGHSGQARDIIIIIMLPTHHCELLYRVECAAG